MGQERPGGADPVPVLTASCPSATKILLLLHMSAVILQPATTLSTCHLLGDMIILAWRDC